MTVRSRREVGTWPHPPQPATRHSPEAAGFADVLLAARVGWAGTLITGWGCLKPVPRPMISLNAGAESQARSPGLGRQPETTSSGRCHTAMGPSSERHPSPKTKPGCRAAAASTASGLSRSLQVGRLLESLETRGSRSAPEPSPSRFVGSSRGHLAGWVQGAQGDPGQDLALPWPAQPRTVPWPPPLHGQRSGGGPAIGGRGLIAPTEIGRAHV